MRTYFVVFIGYENAAFFAGTRVFSRLVRNNEYVQKHSIRELSKVSSEFEKVHLLFTFMTHSFYRCFRLSMRVLEL